jgi:hypothetical protein
VFEPSAFYYKLKMSKTYILIFLALIVLSQAEDKGQARLNKLR